MRGFVAAALAIVGTLMVYMHSSHDDENDLRDSSLRRKLRLRHPKFINPSFTDPKNVMVKQDMKSLFISDIAPEESADDINNWGTPAKLTSFGYKWVDEKCGVEEGAPTPNKEDPPKNKKKRAALCLYGGISPYPSSTNIASGKGGNFISSDGAPAINELSNVDWVAALYNTNFLPEEDEFELDLFIHTWSETYFCTIARAFDNTRLAVRSIIAEPNDKHMDELFPLIEAEGKGVIEEGDIKGGLRHLSMYFSLTKSLAMALEYSSNCGFEYDLLITGRPDVLIGKPLSFYDTEGIQSMLHRALPPHNEVLYSHSRYSARHADYHYIFNAANAHTFVHKMFPAPDQKWPEILKLTKKFKAHTGFVQEFASNNGIVMAMDHVGYPAEEVARKIANLRQYQYVAQWKRMLEEIRGESMPEHCFPSNPGGWQNHIDSDDVRCFPKYYDAFDSCPPNQNLHIDPTL